MCGGVKKLKILMITVAGISSRFSKSLGRECLKCIYYPSNITESLLYRMIHQKVNFDKYIIVGGFMYDDLEKVIKEEFQEYGDNIILVNNNQYREYGSGYSLYLGLRETMKWQFDEVVFAEGDLFVDKEGFQRIWESSKDVITSNQEEILANKAVAFYYDKNYKIHYIYDTGHKAFEIKEPFLGIFNSGQIWKFVQPDRLRTIYKSISEEEWQGTNLVLIQKYFQDLKREEYHIIPFKKWVNCNTIEDFNRI